MKEIWKLLELLNEYEKKELKSEFYEWEKWILWDTNLFRRDTRDEEWSHIYSTTADTYVISKKYGFIWWLVENDKISNDWIKPRTDLVKEITIVDYKTGDAIWWKNKYTEVEQLIMYLSIQDEPIRFLCEIIK